MYNLKKLFEDFIKKLKEIIDELSAENPPIEPPEEPPIEPPEEPEEPEEPPVETVDEIPFSSLAWLMGGHNGAKSAINPSVKIGSLAVKKDGMSYKWVTGNCEKLGASNSGDASKTLACMFYKNAGGKWVGGKFDWISTSRKTRDFKNIHSGYNGWDADGFKGASEFCFVIVGTNKKRSNVIYKKI